MFLSFCGLRGSNFEPQCLENGKRYLKIYFCILLSVKKYFLKECFIKNRVNLLIFFQFTPLNMQKHCNFRIQKKKKYTNQGPFPWQRDKIIAYFQYVFFVNWHCKCMKYKYSQIYHLLVNLLFLYNYMENIGLMPILGKFKFGYLCTC